MIDASENPQFQALHEAGDKPARWASAPTPTPRTTPPVPAQFGAEGIGLFRTEHMFYGEGSDQPLFLLRKMILSNHRRRAPQGPQGPTVPVRQGDIEGTLEAMDGLPVTVRLLDPPLHEFVPQDEQDRPNWPPRWASGRRGQSRARRRAARVQPDDGPPRRAAGHHLPGGDRDAVAGPLRGRRRVQKAGTRPCPR